jgi:ferredoxin-NADP reductase
LLAGRAGFRVREIRQESATVSTLVIRASGWRRNSHRDALGFAPGQFAWLRLRRWSLLTDGATGRIDAEMLDIVLPGPFRRDQLDYFLCGSSPFVNGVITALDEIGIPSQRIHIEQFDMA